MLFDEDHFITSFRECVDTYCSPALVNIIYVIFYYLLHDTRDNDKETQSSIDSLRADFLKKSKSLIKYTDSKKMINI